MPQFNHQEHSMRGKMNVNMIAWNSYDSPGGLDEGEQYDRNVYIGDQQIGTLSIDTEGTQMDSDNVFYTAENYDPGTPVYVGDEKVGEVPATSPSPLDDFTRQEAIDYMEGGTPVGDAIGETLQEQREQGTGVFATDPGQTESGETADQTGSSSSGGSAATNQTQRRAIAVAAIVALLIWRQA